MVLNLDEFLDRFFNSSGIPNRELSPRNRGTHGLLPAFQISTNWGHSRPRALEHLDDLCAVNCGFFFSTTLRLIQARFSPKAYIQIGSETPGPINCAKSLEAHRKPDATVFAALRKCQHFHESFDLERTSFPIGILLHR